MVIDSHNLISHPNSDKWTVPEAKGSFILIRSAVSLHAWSSKALCTLSSLWNIESEYAAEAPSAERDRAQAPEDMRMTDASAPKPLLWRGCLIDQGEVLLVESVRIGHECRREAREKGDVDDGFHKREARREWSGFRM